MPTGNFPPASHGTALAAVCVMGAREGRGRPISRREKEQLLSTEDNKAFVGRWFTEFWGREFNPAVIDELAAPDIRFEYSLHAPLRGRTRSARSRGSSAVRSRT
jgi:hypothetical protein